ncbi:hypothetical protein BRADI_1g27382v3 [Brachypodium distachyon]|uniref:Uncharacterized protein n=1 Tax=Brachypodium distachyon TaxID=15368 RepID=A0A2K2DLC2_BRADI|nr:hypothetical protein BRADI_1g27382v3 [Brachypodium distachyon]PNT75076.1 hypothetical protein BRADI_1g27382v3 [Brachypodium distachyon]
MHSRQHTVVDRVSGASPLSMSYPAFKYVACCLCSIPMDPLREFFPLEPAFKNVACCLCSTLMDPLRELFPLDKPAYLVSTSWPFTELLSRTTEAKASSKLRGSAAGSSSRAPSGMPSLSVPHIK